MCRKENLGTESDVIRDAEVPKLLTLSFAIVCVILSHCLSHCASWPSPLWEAFRPEQSRDVGPGGDGHQAGALGAGQ